VAAGATALTIAIGVADTDAVGIAMLATGIGLAVTETTSADADAGRLGPEDDLDFTYITAPRAATITRAVAPIASLVVRDAPP
jgi:hypothetical protein